MSLRVLACTLYVLFFAFTARRNLFRSLCATIVLMAVFQHPDMPKSMAGIQGLNLWNVLMAAVLIGWWSQRRYQGWVWDMPPHINRMLVAYFVVVAISVARLLFHPSSWEVPSLMSTISEFFINSFKWVFPGLIMFDICRTRRQAMFGLFSILLLYFLISVQIIKHVPLSAATSSGFDHVAYKQVQNAVGYNRVTCSMMLSGASWAVLAAGVLAVKKSHKYAVLGVWLTVALGQALTGGRSGYLSWGVVGLALALTRWRKFLILIPVVVAAVCIFLPAVRDRMLRGVGIGGEEQDAYEMTSGRNIAWPAVIESIKKDPIIGYGRLGMRTSGTNTKLLVEEGESFPHPHNAYLEVLLDSGVIGFFATMPFFFVATRESFRLFRDKSDPLYGAIGGASFALLMALLVASMGGQTFYPREGSVGMWAGIGLMLRVSVERKRALETGGEPFGELEDNEEVLLTEETPYLNRV